MLVLFSLNYMKDVALSSSVLVLEAKKDTYLVQVIK